MADIFVAAEKKSEKKGVPANEKHIHALSSFCQNPLGFSFQNQEKDEKILLFLRRHLLTNLSWLIPSLLLLLLPPLLGLFTPSLGNLFPPLLLPQNYLTVLLLFYYLFVFNYMFISFISWFYNIGIITQKRVIDIDYSDIVHRYISYTKLNLIEDVTYRQTGFIRSLFNYGDVFVQTAGTHPNFEFLSVPQPAKATHVIQELIGRH
ncbi:MAG: hypothetical protein HYY87_02300 [Candidatus Levybacteria bacterium]|nr:hypothetical protein [Candidatus Levybacteria bacterium]MBI2190134.1 hypothetical protein [Candidatus Levybacteria bacterium]MBI3070112.1 hypothetical protein [Candidatus Levybacteria bacterium]